jgi:hypothetical protein
MCAAQGLPGAGLENRWDPALVGDRAQGDGAVDVDAICQRKPNSASDDTIGADAVMNIGGQGR